MNIEQGIMNNDLENEEILNSIIHSFLFQPYFLQHSLFLVQYSLF